MHDIMTVNAALFNLANGTEIPHSAEIVIEYMSQFPEYKSPVKMEMSYSSPEGSDTIQGQTEHGNVEIKDDQKPKMVHKTFGFQKERVGHFRIWRETGSEIYFHHFWASDDTTTSPFEMDGPQLFVISYSKKTKKAKKFGYCIKKTLRMGFLGIVFVKNQWTWTNSK